MDLLVTDLLLTAEGEIQGEELIQVVERQYPQLPILVITGDITERVDRLQTLGVERVLHKPFEPQELVQAVDALV
jgi:DNA-binding response OmpR family regulator